MCISLRTIKTTPKSRVTKNKTYTPPSRRVSVPCGTCFECVNNKRLDWWFRVEQENKYNLLPNRWFLTLTYNEKKVPRRKGVRTLYKRHPQLFLKRLRKGGATIKYILVGEYGTGTDRPHYHAIVWTNATVLQIESAWGYGNIHYRPITKETVLYTLKYSLSPRSGDNEKKQKEYGVFSKGIGMSYLTPAMYDYHTRDYENPKYTTILDDGTEIPLSRYYRKKIFTTHQNNVHAEITYYEQVEKRVKQYLKLKKLGFKGNFSKEMKNRKIQKMMNAIRQFETKNKKYESKWDISGSARSQNTKVKI